MRPWTALFLAGFVGSTGCVGVVPVGKDSPDDTDTLPTDDTDTQPTDDTDTQPTDDTDTRPGDTDDTPTTGDPIGTMGPGDLVISELMIDPSACIDDDAEYVEVYNASGRDVDLTGLVLKDAGTSWTAGAYVLPAGGYVALWRTPLPGGTQCYGLSRGLPYSAGLALSNLGETVSIEDGTGEVLDVVSWVSGQVSTGRALQLDVGSLSAAANDAAGAWCPSEDLIGVTTNRGTPGRTNIACAPDDTDDTDPLIDTDDTDVPPAGTGDLLLTEVADPPVFDARFVELHNVGTTPIGLSAYSLNRYSNGGTTPQTLALPAVNLAPGAYYVIAANAGVFQSEFGRAADTTWSGVNGNGDDVYALAENGAVVDVYGVIGVDGTGEPWEYTDAGASRLPTVTAPRSPMLLAEWIVGAPFTPGGPATATPGDTGDSGDTWDSIWWETGETGDTDVIDTWTDTDAPPLGGGPSLIVSEIADPVNNNARFVELTNVGNRPFDLGTVELRRYSNGSTTPSGQALNAVSLAPGASWVVAYSGNGFLTEFGFSANQTWNGVNGNGNDVYAIAVNGAVIDVYGVIGVDGTGEPWEYTDVGATRRARVTEASATFRIGEWDIGAAHTPGTHAYTAIPDTDTDDSDVGDTDDSDVVDTDDSDVLDTDDTDDTDPLDTWTDSGEPPLGGGPALILSEIADPLNNNARFVEVTNVGNRPFDLGTVALHRYSNGTTTPTAQPLTDVDLAPGASWVIAYSGNGFQTAFGFAADQLWSGVNGNGNDVYAIAVNGAVIDVYGVIGVDGVGEPWEYTDLGATRRDRVTEASASFRIGEWILSDTHTPGTHAFTAVPDTDTDDTDVVDTDDTDVVDTDDTDVVDTDVVDTDDTDVVDTDVADTDDTDAVDTDDTDVVDTDDTDPVDTVFATTNLFLSEVADPVVFQQRFVEIANPSAAAVDLTGWSLKVYFNGNTTATTIPLVGTIPPTDVFVIAYDAARFQTAYGFAADQQSASINANGNDVYALFYDDGLGAVLIDVYGEIGVNGTGEPWEFLDLIATRVTGVHSPSTTWIEAEWTLAATGETPGAHPL